MTRRGLFVSLLGGLLTAPFSGVMAASQSAWLRYGDDPRQTVEVHARAGVEGRPVLALFHGGDRRGLDRARARDAARALAARGFVVVLADMRMGPGIGAGAGAGAGPRTGAAFIADAAAATAWAADHAADFGGDATRLGVLGLGAGAEAALMIALDRRYMAACGRPGLIRAVASWRVEPARDLTLALTLTRPEAYVRADAPPVWLSGGGDADAVLAARIRAVGGRVELDAGRKASLDGTADFLLRMI